jgi:hypothetical protein
MKEFIHTKMSNCFHDKKILIISRANDPVSKYIKQWLLYSDIEVVSLDFDKSRFSVLSVDIENSNFKFAIDEREYNIEEFQTIYFHRGAIQLSNLTNIKGAITEVKDFMSAFSYYRMAYEVSLKEISQYLIHNGKTIGKDNGGRINKVRMLDFANQVGLTVPKTIVTTKKCDLIQFKKQNDKIITKALDINFIFQDTKRGKLVHALTSMMTDDEIESLPSEFPLSIFQANVEKLVELRIFFVGDDNYSSAIFSQGSGNTQQDYRNYDMDFPNRVVPFKLPTIISEKLNAFKKLAELRTGSFDVILTPNNEYVFLEVNPQGQFMAVSDYCNYYLEKKIVDYITQIS